MHNTDKVKEGAHSLCLFREYLLQFGKGFLVLRVFIVILAIALTSFVSANSHAQSLPQLGLSRCLDLALDFLVGLASGLFLLEREFADHVDVLDNPQASLLGETRGLQLKQRLPSAT